MNHRHLFALPLLLIALMLVAGSAFAQTTPAGTQIRNRASATYQDASGNNYTSLSNEVVTIVLPVYGVSILPDDSGETPPVTPALSQNAIGGQTMFYSYTLSNTGNDNDSYTIAPVIDAVNTTMTLALANVSAGRITIVRAGSSTGRFQRDRAPGHEEALRRSALQAAGSGQAVSDTRRRVVLVLHGAGARR